MTHTTFNYIDLAMQKLKLAKSFTVNYFGICIPKNAIYGRPTRNIYIYIDNMQQFNPTHKRTRFNVHILDARKDAKFHKTTISKHTEWYNLIYAFIEYHDLFDTVCEYQYCINQAGGKPERKQPQTHTGYMYKNGIYSQNRVDPYCYECIDTDVARKIDRYAYVDRQRYIDRQRMLQKLSHK